MVVVFNDAAIRVFRCQSNEILKRTETAQPYMYMCKSPYIKIIVCVLEQLCYRPETSKLCHATESRFNAL